MANFRGAIRLGCNFPSARTPCINNRITQYIYIYIYIYFSRIKTSMPSSSTVSLHVLWVRFRTVNCERCRESLTYMWCWAVGAYPWSVFNRPGGFPHFKFQNNRPYKNQKITQHKKAFRLSRPENLFNSFKHKKVWTLCWLKSVAIFQTLSMYQIKCLKIIIQFF